MIDTTTGLGAGDPSDGDGRANRRGGFVPVLVGGRDTDWAAIDDGLPLEVLGARICALATRMAQATFHWLQMIAEFDRRGGWSGVGIRSCAHWLAWTCSMAAGTAREHVRVARSLEGLPLTCEEMAAGRLSYAKVREITRVADRVDEATLVNLARTATASQLARTVSGFRAADRSRAGQERRRHARWRVQDDGGVSLSAYLPAEEGAVVIAALEAARDDLIRLSRPEADGTAGDDVGGDEVAGDGSGGTTRDQEDRAGGVGTDDAWAPDPAKQLLPVEPADMLLQWARGYLSAAPEDRSGEDRTMVVVHVDAEHLLSDQEADDGREPIAGQPDEDVDTGGRSRGNASCGPDAGVPASSVPAPSDPASSAPADRSAIPADCCQIPGVGGVTRDTAARLACDAAVLGIIRGAGGVVLAHGRRRRTVSAAQRRLLTIRDGGCQFPSCTRISHLEAHHVRHWMHGGRTDPDNLILLCRFHHMACHEGGIQISYRLDSIPGAPRWRFTTREGEPLLGDRLPSGTPGWKHDEWILAHGLDGSAGWTDPEAERIRPTWAGERFSLADAVAVLFTPRVTDDGNDPASAPEDCRAA